MSFAALDAGSTMVRIGESGWRETPAGLKASYDNCGGWMHMALCLKAMLEHGINSAGRRGLLGVPRRVGYGAP